MKMKRTYETMEAHKIKFNAREQVAAAACNIMEMSGQYGAMASCEVKIESNKFYFVGKPAMCDGALGSNTVEYLSAAI